MPAGFFGIDRASVPDMWVPLAREQNNRYVWVIGRLRRGVSIEGARAALEPAFAGAIEDYIRGSGRLSDQERSSLRTEKLLVNRATSGTSVLRWSYWSRLSTLKILLVLTGLVLLIACMNLANLLMARSAARAREIGIRLALGAKALRVLHAIRKEMAMVIIARGVDADRNRGFKDRVSEDQYGCDRRPPEPTHAASCYRQPVTIDSRIFK